jgi:hypothetical protein
VEDSPIDDCFPNSDLGWEWVVLEAASMGVEFNPYVQDVLRSVQLNTLDLPLLSSLALRHRLGPTLAAELDLAGIGDSLPLGWMLEFRRLKYLNRRDVEAKAAEVSRILDALDRGGVIAVSTKGVSLDTAAYLGRGLRMMGDLDFMVLPDQIPSVLEVMMRLGFSSTEFDWAAEVGRPRTRSEDLLWALSPDHLPKFIRYEPPIDIPLLVDFASSFTWEKSEWSVDLEGAIESSIDMSCHGFSIRALDTRYSLLFTILHLFREAWFLRTVLREKDALYKFADVVRMYGRCRAEGQLDDFYSLCSDEGVAAPVGWVTSHVDSMFGTSFSKNLEAQDISAKWLASMQGARRESLEWKGTMRSRLRFAGYQTPDFVTPPKG